MKNDSDSTEPPSPARMGPGRTCLLAISIPLCAIPVLAFLLPRIYDTKYSGTFRADCQNNLKHLGLVAIMYANKNDSGQYPALSNTAGVLAMKAESICPEYLTELRFFQCPTQRKLKRWYQTDPPPPIACDDDQSYFYLGYSIPDQASLERFARAYHATLNAQQTFENDLVVKAEGGTDIVIERLTSHNSYTTDEKGTYTPEVPILIERVPNAHGVKGGNVVYADGHYEWIKWGEKWPMTPEAMDVLLALDALGNE